MKKLNKKKKVIVAMSGGVDSSVAAALLKREGFYIVGAFMKLWTEPRSASARSAKRAQKLAKKLNIPFYVFDFRKKFKKRVVDCFLKEFKTGRTPNPCVICNREIKFELLFEELKTLKADYIATGHYARKRELKSQGAKLKTYKLMRAKDKKKDQSYFLWKLNQKLLKRALFPNGNYTKTQVRALAKKLKLPVLDIPESQEICFIPSTINEFLKKHLKIKPGEIVDTQGKIIGKHQGLWFYTIGQRRGIGLPGGLFYVLDKDLKKNLLIVTKNEKDLLKKELITKDINWVSGKKPSFPLKIKAMIRYNQKPVSAKIKEHKKGKIKVLFSRFQRAITPGQSVVFYKDEELLGGGIII